MLFDKIPDINGPKTSTHTAFEYLEGSTRQVMSDVRSMVSQWWANFPAAEQENIKKRLKSDDVSFSSAIFELLVHQTLVSAGHTVVAVEPEIAGTSKRPDFKMRDPKGQEYILELTEARDQSADNAASLKRRQEIQDRISEIGSGDFFVDVWWFEEPASLDKIGNKIKEIRTWLHGLDYQREMDRGISISTPRAQRPSHRVWADNYKFELTAYPRNLRKEAKSPCLGMNTDGVKASTSEESLKASIKTNASRYGELGIPYFIAINIHDFAIDVDSEVGALFGPLNLCILTDKNTGKMIKKYWEYSGDGQFIRKGKPKNTRVTGVWIFRNLSLFGGNNRKSCVYYHPHAKFPMELDVEAEAFRAANDGSFERSTGKSMNELLGLDPNWPQMD